MEQKNLFELDDTELDDISGGLINTFDAPSTGNTWWKCTCHSCGNVGIVPTANNIPLTNCPLCNSTDIDKEIYPA